MSENDDGQTYVVDDTRWQHDETGLDDFGAAPEEELPEGGHDEAYDGGDIGDEADPAGVAEPDDPHNPEES